MANQEIQLTHHGVVEFENGRYVKRSGSDNWKVYPISAFEIPDPAARPPVGQIQIIFDGEVDGLYTTVVTAIRLPTSPLLAANVGDISKSGFVVHLFETVADRTLQNGNFSFAVLRQN